MPITKAYRASFVYCYADTNRASYKLKQPLGGNNKDIIIGGEMSEASSITVFLVADVDNNILAIIRVR